MGLLVDEYKTTEWESGYQGYSTGNLIEITKHRINKRGKMVAKLAAVALVVGTFAEQGLDVLGDRGHKVPKAVAEATNTAHYNKTFDAASPAGKFTLQYLRTTEVASASVKGEWGFNGTFFANGFDKEVSTFNNGCLQQTAYDIAGVTPTAAAFAEVNPDNSDQLAVKSGNAKSVDLHFNGLNEGHQLIPADTQTQNILETYGCKTGLQQTKVVESAQSSPGVL
jgi:hypothetical protein